MTTEEYRQRMIQAFHNADCDELIAICVLPEEEEFPYLEWLLKNHYKKDACTDAISRQAVLDALKTWDKFGFDHTGCFVRAPKDDYITYIHYDDVIKCIKGMPSVQPKTEPCEDAISRQAAIDCITYDEEYTVECLKTLPSVSTEKTGRFIFVDKAKEHAHCSECDYGDVDLFDGRPHKYCPNCGAKMEVEHENNH